MAAMIKSRDNDNKSNEQKKKRNLKPNGTIISRYFAPSYLRKGPTQDRQGAHGVLIAQFLESTLRSILPFLFNTLTFINNTRSFNITVFFMFTRVCQKKSIGLLQEMWGFEAVIKFKFIVCFHSFPKFRKSLK